MDVVNRVVIIHAEDVIASVEEASLHLGLHVAEHEVAQDFQFFLHGHLLDDGVDQSCGLFGFYILRCLFSEELVRFVCVVGAVVFIRVVRVEGTGRPLEVLLHVDVVLLDEVLHPLLHALVLHNGLVVHLHMRLQQV